MVWTGVRKWDTTPRLESEVSRHAADVMGPAWVLQTSTPVLTSFFQHHRDIHPADTNSMLRHAENIPPR